MKTSIFKILVITLLLGSQVYLAGNTYGNTLYFKKKLAEKKLDLTNIGLKNCDLAKEVKDKIFLITCENPSKDSEYDYGKRLYLFDLNQNKPVILFEAHGAMDAYSIQYTFFSNNKAGDPLVVFAEKGTEYSWGVNVYLLKDTTMQIIGYIGAMKSKTSESAISEVSIEDKKGELIMSFTSDVDIPIDRSRETYITVPKEEIKYTYKSGTLKQVLSPQIKEKIASMKE